LSANNKVQCASTLI